MNHTKKYIFLSYEMRFYSNHISETMGSYCREREISIWKNQIISKKFEQKNIFVNAIDEQHIELHTK